ncbi:MAG: NYN domain-containing protein [Alphaproteobacteria bacterium]|nr:NYN domain-containing protein [Alphaproteobacteria bacterium]
MDAEPNIACFIDFENVAIGARDAHLDAFDVGRVLERLHELGKLVVKRAYCDWSSYATAKRPLHGAGFELIEVPHVSYSGKNSADIRMAVDAVDLCHTKAHVDTFAIVSGDSDFSPLVGKLRENDKHVVGIGVRSSTSRLLVECCDAFVFYDDLVQAADPADPAEALDLVAATARALLRDRTAPVWGSHVKQALKRKLPQFDEASYGYRSFNQVLEAAREAGRLAMQKDDPSGGYRIHDAA